MSAEDLYSVLSRGPGRPPAAQGTSPVLERPHPEGKAVRMPEGKAVRTSPGWRGVGRDRLLLGLIAFCVWSVLLVGLGIAIGRGQRKFPEASQGGAPSSASILTVKALVQGADLQKNQRVADLAVKFLKQRYGGRHEVFKRTEGRDLWVCVGRFSPERTVADPEIRRLAEEVSGLSFRLDPSTPIRFRGAEPVALQK